MAAGDEARTDSVTPVPPLPPRLADPRPVVGVGIGAWFAGAVAAAASGHTGTVLWTCLAGGGLGFVGFAIMQWQRSAARRGSRSAQRGLR